MTRRKILAIGAHDDDDVIIGVGGILLLRHKDDLIDVLVLTNGQNSHAVVLDVHNDPDPSEVADARRWELRQAEKVLRETSPNLRVTQWVFPDTCGVLTAARDDVEKYLEELFVHRRPDVVYFQAPDAHEDHRLAHHATATVLKKIGFRGEAYTYAIWTKELAAKRPEVDASMIEDFTGETEVIDVREALPTKRRALHQFTSQVQVWPYLDWQPQREPILDADFLNYFLRGEEVIARYNVK